MSGIDPGDAVVVLTGASSGIDRALALALAREGAKLVLAARGDDDLDELARDCEQAGGHSLVVPTDVASAHEVEGLGRRAVEHFGGFDVWINGAAVMAYGSFWDVPVAAYRQVIETNLFGTVHGCRQALSHFLERGQGVLINIDSLYGRITSPYVSPYVVSKFGVRGLSLCLRQETAHLDGIDVCAVLPQAVDTPIFRHAANYTGQEITALPAAADPDRVVRAILRCMRRPRREVVIGVSGRVFAWGQALMPRLYEWAAPRAMRAVALRDAPAPTSQGNVFRPEPELNRIGGGWRRERRRLRLATAGALAGTGLVAAASGWRRRHRRSG